MNVFKLSFLILYFIISFFLKAHADELPVLYASKYSASLNGKLNDGFKITAVKIFHSNIHYGFRLWIESASNMRSSNVYEVHGTRSKSNKLRVRIEGGQSVLNNFEHSGVLLVSKEPIALFDIVVDGQQNVKPDKYDIVLNAGVLVP